MIRYDLQIECKAAFSKIDSNARVNDEKTRKIFVGGIPLECTERRLVNDEDHLKEYFGRFGEIKNCRIIYKHESNVSRGFGFVIFKDKEAADEVIARKDEHYIHGKWVECKTAILRQEMEQKYGQTFIRNELT